MKYNKVKRISYILGVVLFLSGCVENAPSNNELELPVLDVFNDSSCNCTIERDTLEIGIFLIEITHTYFNIGIPTNKQTE